MRVPYRVVFPAVVLASLLLPSCLFAQLPSAGDTTSPPVPGAGHDYLGGVSETVNPANGSVSLRIPLRIPSGRELAIPLSFAYDSNGAFYYGLGTNGGSPNWQTITNVSFSKGGWSYTFPMVTSTPETWTQQYPNSTRTYTCFETLNYVFQDPTGNRHNLNLEALRPSPPGGDCGTAVTSGGEGPVLATLSSTTPTIIDGNGTVYSFPAGYDTMATAMTDRNGNTVSLSSTSSSASVTDTVGRTAISVGTFGSNPDGITVAGLTSPWNAYWTTASAAFTITVNNLNPPYSQNCPTSLSNSAGVISQIVLPNGQTYTFAYDSTYGMLNKITYPTGGYVRYVWGLNSQAEVGDWTSPDGSVSWTCRYDVPAVTDRYVSFDGSTEVLHQHFSYGTTWSWPGSALYYTSKTATVVTYDLIRNVNFTTSYTYSPVFLPCVPDINPNSSGCANGNNAQVPVEQTIKYFDTNSSLLRTVSKSWYRNDPRTLGSVQTTLDNGQSSLTINCYNTNEQLTESDSYDLGTTTVTPPSCSNGVPSGTVAGQLLRARVTNYAPNTAMAANHVIDEPSSVIAYSDANKTVRVAETDYTYDNPVGTTTSGIVQHGTGCNCGNLTQESRWLNTNGTTLNTTYTNDDTGQRLSMTDPCGNTTCGDVTGSSHTTSYSYADVYTSCGGAAPPSSPTNAYLTQITNPLGQTQKFCYGYDDGQVRSSTDPNSQTTTYKYNDSLHRLTETDFPDNGKTTLAYNDSPYNSSTPSPNITTTKAITSSTNLTTLTAFNGMGQTVRSVLTSDPECSTGDRTDTTYDGLGRVYTVSNPYCTTSDPTYGLATHVYDALGRTTQVTEQDGSKVIISYSGNCTTVTDEAGNSRKSCSDGLGRLTQVLEDPGSSPHLNFETDYAYDTLDNLLCAAQKGTNTGTFTYCASIPASWRPRQFAYDSLSRLTSSTNPESNTAPSNGAIVPTTYSYDANGNLSTETAPAPNQTGSTTVTTAYQYDALNRLTYKSYSDTNTPAPTAQAGFYYDQSSSWGPISNPIGRLTTMASGSGGTAAAAEYSYDVMGRRVLYAQCAPSNCGSGSYNTAYTYDLAGDTLTASDGEGHTISYAYDTASRPSQVTSTFVDSNHPATLATVDSSVGYYPSGALRKITFGNNLTQAVSLESRLQPCRINWNSSASYITDGCNDGSVSGTVQDYFYAFGTWGSTNNGNITIMNAAGNQAFNRSFTYDSLNRLSQMHETSGTGESCKPPSSSSNPYTLTWGYDAWGNRNSQSPSSGTCSFSQTASTNNRLASPYQYDTAGNMTYDGNNTYYYDAEHRLIQINGTLGTCSSSTMCYVYDANGMRARKTEPNGSALEYIRDLQGNVVSESSPTGGWQAGYVYLGSRFLAEYANGTTYFIHPDHLGSTRLVTSMTNPSSPVDSLDYLPFGEQIAGGSTTSHKFTGKERDSESGLDNFEFRFYSSSMGRFMKPDDTEAISSLGNPQGLNLYSYVQNNPTNSVDPDGHDCIYINNDTGKYEGFNSGDCDNSTEEKANTGYYVDGTVNTITTTTGDASGVVTGYNGTSDTGSLLAGTLSTPLNNTPSDALNANAVAIFSDINRRNILANTAKIYGAGALIGLTGGTACYYLCPAATVTTLGIAASPLLPIVPSALQKLQQLGLSVQEATEIVESPASQKLVDNLNNGNINVIQDVGGKLVRITLDPSGQRIISAGLVRARNITNGIASGRFTPQ